MTEEIFKLINIHFSLNRKGEIVFTGETVSDPEKIKLNVWVNDIECDYIRKVSGKRISGAVRVNDSRNYHIKIKASDKYGKVTKFSRTLNALDNNSLPVYYIDDIRFNSDGSATIVGWALDYSPLSVKLYTNSGEEIKAEKFERNDLINIFPEIDDINAGFLIKLTSSQAKDFPWRLIIEGADGHRAERDFTKRTYIKESWKDSGGIKRKIARSYETFHEEGFKALCYRIGHYIRTRGLSTMAYQKWIERIEPTKMELMEERRKYKSLPSEYKPLFSIVVPVFNTPEKYFKALIDSVKGQTYENWELVLADAGTKKKNLDDPDKRIKYVVLSDNGGISANTNEAIKQASGDWIVFADHDDLLSFDALFKVYLAIKSHPDAGYVYSDEDKISASGKKRLDPNFKPDYNPDLLCGMNYISHLSVVRKTLIDEVGLLDPEMDGSQDYDLTLRCVEKLKDDQIIHIPEVLYHWRMAPGSTADKQESKLYAFEAGRRAVQAHIDRLGIPGTVEETNLHGRYRIKYHWQKRPKVSVIIPNMDHVEDLRRCINSIFTKTDYPDYEIVIIENNSKKEETFLYYKELEKDSRVTIVTYKGSFNYSAINNYSVSFAKGDFFLLLNNDTEVISSNWMSEMVDNCIRSDVGIVGAKLYYDDDTIQHAGVVIGLGGVAGHVFRTFPKSDPGFMGRLVVCQDYCAVTAACMLVKRSAFEKAGGFSEDLAVAFNDIDFCLKVGKMGYRVLFTPFAELYHYESKSRGLDDTPEKQDRFNQEIMTFKSRWNELLEKGDPCYNRHFTLKRFDCSFNEDLTHE